MEVDESPFVNRLRRVLYTVDMQILHIYATLLEVNCEIPVGSEYLHSLLDVEGNLDLPWLVDLEGIVPPENVEDKFRLLSLCLCSEEDTCPEELEGVIGGSLDGSSTLDSHLVGTSEILAFLKVFVSSWLAVSGQGKQVISADESVAELYGVVVNRYLGVFS